MIEKIDDYVTSIGHHDRCGTMIEPRLSLQWFVRMKPLAEPALDAWKRGGITFHPDRWSKVYENWMTNIRDWCISRQLWWGHRIPVYTCDACDEVIASVDAPSSCQKCGAHALTQDEDVLDTWFSAWLWPFATLGWPEETPDLARYFPSDVLVTAPEILFFWVARMIMASLEFRGKTPFRDVYLHGIVRDAKGRKMSKSLGNSPDPIDLIDRSGADALRFTMMMLTPQGSDVLFDESKVEIGKHFANKIWNASRLVQASLAGWTPPRDPPGWDALDLPARWILGRLAATVDALDAHLGAFEMLDASRVLYDFVWHDYCDWYLEMVKPRWSDPTEGRPVDAHDRLVARWVAWKVLDGILRLLHPFMPFVTEELWQAIPHDGETLALAAWPKARRAWFDAEAERQIGFLQQVVIAVRNLRAEAGLPPGKRVPLHVRGTEVQLSLIERLAPQIEALARVESLRMLRDGGRPAVAASAVVEGAELFLPLEGLIDLDEERARLSREADKLLQDLESTRRKLRNQDFLTKARPQIVEREHQRLAQLEETLEKLRRAQDSLRVTQA